MSMQPPHPGPVGPDTLVTVKVIIDGNNRRFKLALRDLGANILPGKLRFLLAIPPEVSVKFERFSDSLGDYVALDSGNPSVYKQLYRAAKAKLKLRLKATVVDETKKEEGASKKTEEKPAADATPATAGVLPLPKPEKDSRQSYLDTVLASQPPMLPTFPAISEETRKLLFSSLASAYPKPNDAPPPPPLPPISQLSQPTVPTLADFPAAPFCIDCNACGESIPNEHYHCSICDDGDFDLCPNCVNAGLSCQGEGHWLIKRTPGHGHFLTSVTETIAPKKTVPVEEKKAPVVATESSDGETVYQGGRTCNCCIVELPGNQFVTCENCPDYDLCFFCMQNGAHGHHPAHSFRAVDPAATLSPEVSHALPAGRGVAHDAVCDGCDKAIKGVRHKCLTCPDWDYCSTCVLSAGEIHPGHRFAPLYEPIALVHGIQQAHHGIFCDGPLCAIKRRKDYIRGDRYKCAVCHDTDFCANCEALPNNNHNKTHPLIKFKTPVRHVQVTTLGENNNKVDRMGDRPRARHAATETNPPAPSANAATQVQTVAEVKPAEMQAPQTVKEETVEPIKTAKTDLEAWFMSDSTPDGTRFAPNHLVSQSWTLRNPGPKAWPAGCAVHFIGGDDMRNLDAKRPSSVDTMTTANRSNVLDHTLEPGQTAVFNVLLKSPAHEGRVISYWRLKTPEGHPFGHKLWVDITVTDTPAELPEKKEATDVTPKPEPAEAEPKKEDEVSEESKSEASSTMIFPKLEKESPESSVHNVAEAPSATVAPTTKTEEQDLLDDIESLELEDEDETEDGFMTDEEYDILDASDEDFLMEAQNAVAQKK